MSEELDFFARDALVCAAELVGCALEIEGVGGVVVETEAYRAEGDPACHTFFRKKTRTFVAENEPGVCYVYLNYGIHWMLNFLTVGEFGPGFVLVRALRPESGIERMVERRGRDALKQLCSGPGKLTQAMAIDASLHGRRFGTQGKLIFSAKRGDTQVRQDRRIGITRAVDFPWRFTAVDAGGWLSWPFKEI